MSTTLSRRRFLGFLTAPAIVRASSLMAIVPVPSVLPLTGCPTVFMTAFEIQQAHKLLRLNSLIDNDLIAILTSEQVSDLRQLGMISA